MPAFSPTSLHKLSTVHPDLRRVLERAIKVTDFAVLCGHRGQAEQAAAFLGGTSNAEWPNSRHNSLPSEAVDVAPYPIDWKDEKRFYLLAGVILGIAETMGVRLRWGGHFKSIRDLPHFELV